MAKFAENLKRLMKDRGVSARVLSQATQVPTSTLSEWTAGREPKLGEPVLRVAKFFGVTLEYLVLGTSENETFVENLVAKMEEDFTTVHQGVYRVRVEKLINEGQKKKG